MSTAEVRTAGGCAQPPGGGPGAACLADGERACPRVLDARGGGDARRNERSRRSAGKPARVAVRRGPTSARRAQVSARFGSRQAGQIETRMPRGSRCHACSQLASHGMRGGPPRRGRPSSAVERRLDYGRGFDFRGEYVPQIAPCPVISTRISPAWHSMFSLCMQSVALHEATADGAEPRCSCGFAIYPPPGWWTFPGTTEAFRNLQTTYPARKYRLHNDLRMILRSSCERFSTLRRRSPPGAGGNGYRQRSGRPLRE